MSLRGKIIGVMMGGRSSERNVSIKSGTAVCEALKSARVDVKGLEVKQETEEEIRSLILDNGIGVVFVAMHGGFGEDGRLQRVLEKINVPFTGSQEKSSRLAMDKLASRLLFEKAKLHVPKYKCARRTAQDKMKDLSFPLVIKPSCQGSSIGISFVDSATEVQGALAEAFKYDETVLLEEFIRGREITVSVLDGQALPIVEIIPKKRFFDFEAKYEKGLTEYVVPALLEAKVAQKAQQDAVAAFCALCCRHLARVDMILKNDKMPYILEVNTIPGFTATSLFPKAAYAAGFSFQELCLKLCELAVQDNGKK